MMSGFLTDTHTHLQLNEYSNDRDRVIRRAKEAGVLRMIVVGFDMATSRAAIQLAQRYEGLYASVGIHPHEARNFTDKTIDRLRDLARSYKVVAIGEIGLDYYRDLSPRDRQGYAFERQLELANELDLPVIIHNRRANKDMIITLERYVNIYGVNLRGVMHCFSGDWGFAKRCLDVGFYISIAGPVTYPNSDVLREVAAKVPLDRLLIETDCPWLPPQHKRGRRNEPAYVRFIARRIADLRGIPLSQLAEATSRNAAELFKLEVTG